MNQNKLQEYRERLEKERIHLIDELMKEESIEDFGSDVGQHEDEETNEAESLGNQLALGQVTRERVTAIDAALNKIAEGKYAVCEKCGGVISEAVLDVSPESRYCQSCKVK